MSWHELTVELEFEMETLCSFCGIYPSTLEGDTPEHKGAYLCAECYWEIDTLMKRKRRVKVPSLDLKCEDCGDTFQYDSVYNHEGRFCSELCNDRYIGSLAGVVTEEKENKEIDYDSDEVESFEEEESPADYSPGKVYEADGPGFYSRVKVQKDGTLKEKRGTFTPRGFEKHMTFKSWNDWRAFCWPFLK
jgi:hypothetical protein